MPCSWVLSSQRVERWFRCLIRENSRVFPSTGRELSLLEDASRNVGRPKGLGGLHADQQTGHVGRHLRRSDPGSGDPGRENGPGCGGPGAHSVPVLVPVPTEARCRTPATGAALALLRSPFSGVLAIRPNLLRQEVQMSPNCFHSDAVFSSEAAV